MSELDLEVAWKRHVAADRSLLDGLLARHREKHRRYHTATHVAWVLRHIDELAAAEPVARLDEVVAAAFYHDAIYEPSYPANERASARLARRDLDSLGWSTDSIDRVAAMIEATEHGAGRLDPADDDTDHATDLDTDHATSVLLDADLAVLGADPAGYDAYATGVRREYHHVPDDVWRDGRSAVLRGFLDEPWIFRTAAGQERWEDRARANLAAELATLSG